MPGWGKSIIAGLLIAALIASGGCVSLSDTNGAGQPGGDPGSSTALGSKLNPVPVGQTVTYHPYSGNRYRYYDTSFLGCTLNVTLLEAVKGEKADRIMAERGLRPLSRGHDFLLARFKVEIVDTPWDDEELIYGGLIKSADGNATKLYGEGNPGYDPLLNGTLRKGESTEGWVVLEYDKTESAPLIVFDHFGEDSLGLWFKTTGAA